MSIIYEYLNEKACSEATKDDVCYIDYLSSNAKEYTFSDLIKLVDICVDYLKSEYIILKKEPFFQIINNSFYDVAMFIALMEVGFIPIPIYKDRIYNLYYKNKNLIDSDNNVDNLNYNVELPILSKINNQIISSNHIIVEKKDMFKIFNPNIIFFAEFMDFDNDIVKISKEKIKKILYFYFKDVMFDLENDNNFDFGIMSSGTAGITKVKKIDESHLISKLFNNYDLTSIQTFVNSTPISSISGIIYNIYLPLIGKKSKILFNPVGCFNNLFNYENLNIIISGSYVPFLEYDDVSQLANKIDNIILIGNRISYNTIDNIRLAIPNLKKYIFWNYYGRTENMGLVAKCNEKSFLPVYICFTKIFNDSVVFTFDKKNLYEKKYINNSIKIEKSIVKFNNIDFIEIMPICSNYFDYKDFFYIKDGVFNELLINNNLTGDYGFDLFNYLYVLGRESDFFKFKNQYFFLPAIEKIIKEKLRTDCFIVTGKDAIDLYVPCKIVDFVDNNFFESICHLFECLKFIDIFNFPIGNLHVIEQELVPYSSELGKFKRNELSNIEAETIKSINLSDFNNEYCAIVQKRFINLLKKDISLVKYQNFFALEKGKNISINDIIKIICNFRVLDFKEDDKYFYLAISDEFLIFRGEKKNYNNSNKIDVYNTYLYFYNLGLLRNQILIDNNLIETVEYNAYIFFDKDDKLSFIIYHTNDEYEEINNYDIINNINPIYTYRDVIKISKYEKYIYGNYYDGKYSIDEENVIYFNDMPLEANYMTTDIAKQISNNLINIKKSMEKSGGDVKCKI